MDVSQLAIPFKADKSNTKICVVLNNKMMKPCQACDSTSTFRDHIWHIYLYQKLNIHWKYHSENWAVVLTFPCFLLERQIFLCSWISYWFLQNKTKEKPSPAHYKWAITAHFAKYSLQLAFQHLQSCLQFIFIMGNIILSLVQHGKAFCLWRSKAFKCLENIQEQHDSTWCSFVWLISVFVFALWPT